MKFLKKLIWIAVFAPVLAIADTHEHEHEHEGHEQNLNLTEEAVKNAEIELREISSATLAEKLKVSGRISPISSGVAHISSRFSGIIREVTKDVGEKVKAGDVLAVIESNHNLQKFEVRALQGGVITDRHATVGESIKEDEALFIVMDLDQLSADFTIFQRDISKIKIGQSVDIYPSRSAEPRRSKISFISPIVDETTQSRTARAVISNPNNSLAPGAFITGEISTAEYQVPIAVTSESIQSIKGKNVIFVKSHDGFEKREVSLGRSDGQMIEVLSGALAGEVYAASNSFILKAEHGKSEAEHEH